MNIDELNDFLRASMPFAAMIDITATAMSASQAVMTLEWRPELCTADGMLHGGALMALSDCVGATLAYANLPDGANGTSTIESKTNFFGAVTAGTVVATATPLHVGQSTIVVETELRQDHRLVAKTTQTQSVLLPQEQR